MLNISLAMLNPLLHNHNVKASKEVREYMASLGRKGGKSRNPGKALTSAQARANALARWNKPGARKTRKEK